MRAEIRLKGRKFDIRVPLGDGPPTVTQGGAVYDEAARPERTALTDYVGNSLIMIDVPVLLDGWPHRNVWPEVRRLARMSRGRNGNRPPVFRALGPIPHTGLRCVMAPPEYGNALRDARGRLVRQHMTLKLVQFVDPDIIRVRPLPTSLRLPKRMNLIEVAARYLGNPKLAKRIARINGIRDIRKKLPKGRPIRLPARAGLGSNEAVD